MNMIKKRILWKIPVMANAVFYLFSNEDTINIPAALNIHEYQENNKKVSPRK
jgi:hypothetical protein